MLVWQQNNFRFSVFLYYHVGGSGNLNSKFEGNKKKFQPLKIVININNILPAVYKSIFIKL
jgi:hypothetical protein